VQPGNSGGPVLDGRGGVVAVIVSKLNTMGVADKTGDVPQNVNFAIKSTVALGFVESVGLETREMKPDAPDLDKPSLARLAREFTFLVECDN
jgi:serine protease Do